MTNAIHILIVNPVSSISYLAESFREQNIITTALYTPNVVNEFVPLDIKEKILSNQNLFDYQLYGEYSDIMESSEIFNQKYDFVLNGFEYSTPLTDKICQIHCPKFANNTLTSKIRTYKYYTQEACKNLSNIKYINQLIVSPDDFKNPQKLKLILNEFIFPVFCKPEAGAASIGVAKIDNLDELFNYFANLNPQSSYILQEFVNGSEFFVDTVSLHGVHYVSFIGTYEKENINSVPVYRQGKLVTDRQIWSKLIICINDVLNTIEMNNGLCHTEFMIDAQNNVYLLEVNSRISGGGGVHCKMANYSGLMSQEKMLAKYLISGQIKSNYIDDATCYVSCVDLFKFQSGYLKDISNELYKISSVRELLRYKEPNTYIDVSNQISLQDSIGCVILTNENSDQLMQDVNSVKQLEILL